MIQKNTIQKFLLSIGLFIGLISSGNAQWSFAAGVGESVYVGDIGTKVFAGPAINADIWYQFSKNFSYRLSSGFVWMKADDDNSFPTSTGGTVLRGRDFETVTYEIFGDFIYQRNYGRISPYFGLGAGVLFMGVSSRNYITGGFSNTHAAGVRSPEGRDLPNWTQIISASLGVKYAINGKFSLLLEYSGKATLTDILDGVSARNPSPNAADFWFPNSNQRLGGGPDANDMYGVLSLKVMYTPKQYRKHSQYMDYRRQQEYKRFKRRKTWKRW